MHFKSIATFLAKSANEKKSVRSTKGGVCGVRTQCRSHHHHMYTGMETSGCGHATFGFRRAPATAWTWWCIGKQRLFQTSRLSPNSHLFPNRAITAKRRPAVLSTVRKVWMVRSTGAGARKLFERIVRRRRDMQRLIPYRTRGMVARPASGHSWRPTSL